MIHRTFPNSSSPKVYNMEVRDLENCVQGDDTQNYVRRVLREATELNKFGVFGEDHESFSFYKKFMETQISTSLLLISTLLMALLRIIIASVRLIVSGYFTSSYSSMKVVTGIRFAFGILLPILFWLLWYLKLVKKRQAINSRLIDMCVDVIPYVQSALPILWSMYSGLELLQKVIIGQCPTDLYLQSDMCNLNNDTGGLPLENIAFTILVPLTIFIILPDTSLRAMLSAFIISCSSLIAAGVLVDYRQMIPLAIAYSFCGLLIISETQRQRMSLFFIADKLHTLLTEKERNATEEHANEMRHMISNVAHDLKTPLSSFSAGVDMIEQIVNDCKKMLQANEDTVINPQHMLQHFEEISSCVGDIHSTNAFMIMTINRCIDYTKASKGIKLVPKLETVDLQDTINLPLRVVSSLKAAVRIHMSPLSADPSVCSHVITDKQWLQENLLCLLSNAIKYSSRGTVDISVSVVDGSRFNSLRRRAKHEQKMFSSGAASNSKIVPSCDDFDSVVQEESEAGKNHIMKKVAIEQTNEGIARLTQTSIQSIDSDSLGYGSIFYASSPKQSSPHANSRFLKFEVEDTGIGLSVDARRSLFKPFKQAQRLAGGTGLGLFSLAKRMEALGGHCGVTTRRDKEQGSLFWFAFPYRPDAESASSSKYARSSPRHSDVSLSAASLSRNIQQSYGAVADVFDHDKAATVVNVSVDRYFGDSPKSSVHASHFPDKNIIPFLGEVSNAECKIISPLRILLVDDSLLIIKTTKMVLKRHKHEVVTAENGMEALEIIMNGYRKLQEQQQQEQQIQQSTVGMNMDSNSPQSAKTSAVASADRAAPFDVVLMDLNMPVMDGLESVRRVRAFEETLNKSQSASNEHTVDTLPASYHQFIIGVTANSDQQTKEDSFAVGMDDFIPKPFKVDLLYECLRSKTQRAQQNSADV